MDDPYGRIGDGTNFSISYQYAWTCDEQPRTCEERIRTIKNIQTYSMKLSCFNLRFSSWQHKQTVREMDYTFMQDPYGGRGDSW